MRPGRCWHLRRRFRPSSRKRSSKHSAAYRRARRQCRVEPLDQRVEVMDVDAAQIKAFIEQHARD